MKTIRFTLMAGLLLGLAQPSPAADALSETLQKGLFEEEANHNLDAAIKAYQAVLQQTDEQRKFAATAIFRLGECYRKLGKTNEAAAQYERVLQEFPGETALATLSRQNLTGLGLGAKEFAPRVASKAARSEQKRLYEEEIKLAEQQLELVKKQIATAQAGSDAIIPKEREILALRRQLAGLDLGAEEVSANLESGGQIASTDDEEKEVQRIKAMIKDSPDLINSHGAGGGTPLHQAAGNGRLVVARFLLANKADVNARDAQLATPLHRAAGAGHKSMTELLLANGAKVDAADNNLGTPLHLASANGFKSVTELLIANKAEVNVRNKDGKTPLHMAAEAGQNSLAEVLLARGADIAAKDSTGRTPLHSAVHGNHLTMVKLLLSQKAEVNAVDNGGATPLLSAAMLRNVAIAQSLLDSGADVNLNARDGNSPVRYAIRTASPEMLKLLLAHSPNLEDQTYDGLTPLQSAVLDYPAMANFLLAAGANVNVRFKQKPGVGMPRINTPDGSSTDVTGDTPLIVATLKSHGDLVDVLLANGAEVDAQSPDGRTALFYAAWKGSLPMVQSILGHHPDTEIRDNQGFTPLHFASSDQPAMIEALLKGGANPNLLDASGQGRLHWAVINYTPSIVRLLVTNGANVNLMNREGDTALSLAQRNLANLPALDRAVRDEIARFLIEHGADENIRRRSFISLSRKAANLSTPLFVRGTNGYNRYTLLELVAAAFGSGNTDYPFPDFGHVKIRKLSVKAGTDAETSVDVYEILRSGDCSQDLLLEWGDIVEVPELDHAVNDQWRGLTPDDLAMLQKCLKREVEIIVKGDNTRKILTPNLKPLSPAPPFYGGAVSGVVMGVPQRAQRGFGGNNSPAAPADSWNAIMSFRLKSVLTQANVVRVSSDLSRVKVKRAGSKSGQIQELLFNLSEGSPYDPRTDLWLRDGDVIEVPEK